MEVLFVLAGLFTVVTVAFIAVAIYYPEWVGITGKVARNIESEHRHGTTANELGDGIAGYPRPHPEASKAKKPDPS